MISDRIRGALERKPSAELLRMRHEGGLTDEVGRVIEELLRGRGVDPASPPPAAPASADATKTGDPLVVARRVRMIAWFQLLTAAVFAFMVLGAPLSLFGVVGALIAALNAAAGILTLREHRSGYWLSVWNHVAQVPVLGLPGLVFHYIGLGGIVVLVTSGPGLFINAQINPGFELYVGAKPEPYGAGLDLLSIGIVALLLSALRLRGQ